MGGNRPVKIDLEKKGFISKRSLKDMVVFKGNHDKPVGCGKSCAGIKILNFNFPFTGLTEL